MLKKCEIPGVNGGVRLGEKYVLHSLLPCGACFLCLLLILPACCYGRADRNRRSNTAHARRHGTRRDMSVVTSCGSICRRRLHRYASLRQSLHAGSFSGRKVCSTTCNMSSHPGLYRGCAAALPDLTKGPAARGCDGPFRSVAERKRPRCLRPRINTAGKGRFPVWRIRYRSTSTVIARLHQSFTISYAPLACAMY